MYEKFLEWQSHLSWSRALLAFILALILLYCVVDAIYLIIYHIHRKWYGRKL